MRSILLVAALIGLSAAPALAAPISHCVIEVHGTIYLDGPCDFHGGRNGSFELRSAGYDAYVFVADAIAPKVEHREGALGGDADDAQGAPPPRFVLGDMDEYASGYWQRDGDATSEDNDLGAMRHDGACWVNAISRICAYR